MAADVTVITASIPGRENLLAQCVGSVHDQTLQPECHMICSHELNPRFGPGWALNNAAAAVRTEWMRICDDDNWLLPNDIETVAPHFNDADVIYTWDASGHCPRIDCARWPRERLADVFAMGNFLDENCFVRTSVWHSVGGMDEFATAPDHRLWKTLAGFQSIRFLCLPIETWVYGNANPSTVTPPNEFFEAITFE